MKISAFLFAFFTLLTSAQAQIDTTDFFPMQKGNYWLYVRPFNIGWDYMDMTVMGDTLMPNGRRYSWFHQKNIPAYEALFPKRDSITYREWYFRKCSNNVYIFEDSVGEYKYFDLSPDIQNLTVWEAYKDTQDNYILGREVYFPLILNPELPTDYAVDWLPNFTSARTFSNVLIDPATNKLSPWRGSEIYWSVLEGIGMIRANIDHFAVRTFTIRGAIINGVKLGITTIGQRLSSVETEKNIVPGSMNIQAYPNPFNSTTRLNVQLKSAGMTELMVFNALGQKAATIFEGYKSSGNFTFSFNADHLTSGIYFVILKQGGFFCKEKIILLK